MDRQKLCLTYKFLIAFTLVFWWVPITFAQQKEKFVTKKSVLDPVIKARFPNSSVADIVDQSRGLEPVNLPDTTGYSIGDIINVKGELYELVAGDQQRNVYRGVIEDRAGSLLGDDTFEWETSPANIRVNLSRAVLGGSPPARIFIEFHSGNVYAETGIVRASGSDTTTTYRYHHDTSEPAIPSSGLSVGDTFDVSFYTNATKTTPLNIHSTSNRWEQDKRGDITGISIKDSGTLEGTANSVTGLNFLTGLNVTRSKGSNEVSITNTITQETGPTIVSKLSGLTGSARLPGSAIRDLPESGIANTPRRVTELPAESASLDRETIYLTADYTKTTGINITPQLFAGTELDSVTNPDAPSNIGTQGWYRKSDAGFTFGEINPDLPSDFILISDKRIYVADNTQTNLGKIFLGTTEYILTRVDQTNTKLFSTPGPSGPNNPLVDYYTIGGTGLPASGDWDDLSFETAGSGTTIQRKSSLDITLGTGTYNGGCTDGTTIWFINSNNNRAEAYIGSTRTRDSSKDISFTRISGFNGYGGCVVRNNTFWIFQFDNDNYETYLHAYNKNTQARDTTKDKNSSNNGEEHSYIFNVGDQVWTTDYEYQEVHIYNLGASGSSYPRITTFSITNGGGMAGGFSDGTTAWIIFNNTNIAQAYNGSTRARESSKDITLGTATYTGGNIYYNNDFYVTAGNVVRGYGFLRTSGTKIPPLINIPKGNYENRNTDWARSEFDAPEVQSDKDFKIAVEEQRPGTRQDKNLSFVASGSTFTTTTPFPGILRITYNNLSTDTDTYQRYTIFVPLEDFEDSKAPHLLKIGSVNYSLSYLETETNQAVYRSSVVKSTERITSASTISAMNVQALDNSWFGETGGGKFLKTITKHDLSTFTNAIQEVHTLPGSPHEGQVIELLNDLTVPGGAILTAQESSGTSSASVNINGLFTGYEIDARYDNGSAGGDLGSLNPTNSNFNGLVSFSNARASGSEANKTFFISPNGNTYAPTKVWINGIRYSVGSAVNRDYFPLTGLDGSFLKAGRKYYVNVEIANGDKLFADISYKAGTELIWDGIHWIKRLKGLSEEEVDNRITTKVAPFSILPKPTGNTKYIPADQICQEVATVSAYTALTKDNNRMYCIPETSQ